MLNFPEILPLRFYQKFDTVQFLPFKNQDSALPEPQQWKVDEAINLQFQIDTGESLKLYRIVDSVPVFLVNSTNVTPGGWTGSQVHQISYTPDTQDLYQFELHYLIGSTVNNITTSDCLDVRHFLNDDYVKVEWTNSENKNGIVYEGTNYTPVTFLRGMMQEVTASGEFAIMDDSNGQDILLKSTQKKVYKLEGWGLSNYQVTQMALVSGCDNVTINGNRVLFDKVIGSDREDSQVSINNIEGQCSEYDWDTITPAFKSQSEIDADLFLTVQLLSSAYSLEFRTNKSFKYVINNDAPVIINVTSLSEHTISAPPDSIIDIYSVLDANSENKILSDTISKVTIHQTGLILSLIGMFDGLSNLKEASFLSETIAVESFKYLFNNCTSLNIVNGLDTEGYFTSVTDMFQMFRNTAIKKATVWMNANVNFSTGCFEGCSELIEIRGRINTLGGSSSNFFNGADALEYPLKGTLTDFLQNNNGIWYHPRDCDIVIDTKSPSDLWLFSTHKHDIYTDSTIQETIDFDTNRLTAGTKPIFGINLNSSTDSFFFRKDFNSEILDNIYKIVVNDFGSTSDIDSFMEGFNCNEIVFNTELPNIISASFAFRQCNVTPNWFSVVNAEFLSALFLDNEGTNLFIKTSNALDSANSMFHGMKNLIEIRGILNTTGATNKTNMFLDNDSLIEPDQATRDDLMDANGAIYTNL